MALYVFECSECAQTTRQTFAVGDCPPSVPCVCGGIAGRIFTVPRITTRPHFLREENNLYPGLSEQEVTAERKREDAEYERNCVGGPKPLEAEPDPYAGLPGRF